MQSTEVPAADRRSETPQADPDFPAAVENSQPARASAPQLVVTARPGQPGARLPRNAAKHVCEKCGEKFRQPLLLEGHMADAHVKSAAKPAPRPRRPTKPNPSPSYISDISDIIHQGDDEAVDCTFENPHQCEFCNKLFRHRGDARIHERSHTGEKPYGCSVCDKRFRDNNAAAVHTRTHTGEKPFGCKFCLMRFSQKSPATRHERTHTGVKPHGCTYCDKRFTRKNNAAKHELSHSEKPFGCNLCGRRFGLRTEQAAHACIHDQAPEPQATSPHPQPQPQPSTAAHLTAAAVSPDRAAYGGCQTLFELHAAATLVAAQAVPGSQDRSHPIAMVDAETARRAFLSSQPMMQLASATALASQQMNRQAMPEGSAARADAAGMFMANAAAAYAAGVRDAAHHRSVHPRPGYGESVVSRPVACGMAALLSAAGQEN